MLTLAPAHAWRLAAYAYGALVVAGVAYVQLGMPIQLADGYTLMTSLPGRSLVTGVYDQFFQTSFLRPFIWGQRKVVFALADGRYFEWFRGWDVCQMALLIGLSIRLWQPRRPIDLAVVSVGLAILVGIHTFVGAISEAFPVNPYLTAAVCSLGAANLALGPYRWWRDLLAVLLFVFAALTVESGLLVWVVVVAAYLAGARGVSRGGVAAVTLLLAGYFYLRFAVLDVGGPGLIERSSGFGFAVRDPDELMAIFGTQPLVFYAYNVATSIASVLWSEPRAGVWRLVSALTSGEVPPYMWVNVVASTLSTGVLAHFLWQRRRAWAAWRFEPADRIVVTFLAVLVANAAISFPYTKDEIMSTAGIFYAIAVGVALRDLLERAGTRRAAVAATVGVWLVVMSGAWATRAIGLHLALRDSAREIRNDWAYVDQWLEEQGTTVSTDPAIVALQDRLRGDAIVRSPAAPAFSGPWVERWFGVE